MPVPAWVEWFRRGSIALVAVAIAAASTAGARAASTRYFTASQATRGQIVYAAHCATCHGANLSGQAGPALAGADFQAYLRGSKTAYGLYDFIAKQMPADNPGSLSSSDYLAVTAFILSQNGFPAGNAPLNVGRARIDTLAVVHSGVPAPNTN